VITVKVADEDMMQPAQPYFISSQLDLGALSTIDQKKPLICIEQLSGRKSF
jgi:hypothetical protein